MDKIKKYALAIAGTIGVISALFANVGGISDQINSIIERANRYDFEQPILTNIIIRSLDNSSLAESIPEDETSEIDVTISYEGKETLIIDTIEIQHFMGPGNSVGTGQLTSSGEYAFGFRYHQYVNYNVNPKLVIDPKDSSIINFKITLFPEGEFYSVGGFVEALIGYQDGKGKKGVIPLVSNGNIEDGKVRVPYLFNGDPYKSDLEYAAFEINEFGAIKGMSRAEYDLTKKASGR
jgi:hypothetical protein